MPDQVEGPRDELAEEPAAQLTWTRKEVLELLERYALGAAVVRVADPGGQPVSLGRAEVEGVVQETLASAGLAPVRHVAATIRIIYGARNKTELASALSAIPAIEGVGGKSPRADRVGCRAASE
jgi:hypothetical protein